MYDIDSSLLRIARQKQLFFDYVVIESVQDITRTLHRPEKVEQNPLIYKDKPWETVPYFSTNVWNVLYDQQEGLFKCIYTDWDYDQQGHASGDVSFVSRMRQLYAYSEDGVNWVKPEVGLVQKEGRTPISFLAQMSMARSTPCRRSQTLKKATRSSGTRASMFGLPRGAASAGTARSERPTRQI